MILTSRHLIPNLLVDVYSFIGTWHCVWVRFFSALMLFTYNGIFQSLLEEQQNFNQCMSCEWTSCWSPVWAICVRPVCAVLPSLKLTVPLQPGRRVQEIPARSWADRGKENTGSEMPLPGQVVQPALIFPSVPQTCCRRRVGSRLDFSVLVGHTQPADHHLGSSACPKIHNLTRSTCSLGRVSRHPCHCLRVVLCEISWIFKRKRYIWD